MWECLCGFSKNAYRIYCGAYSRAALIRGRRLLTFPPHVRRLKYTDLTQKSFFAKTNLLLIQRFWAKKNLNLVESSIFYALSKSHLKCSTTAF